jgi:hypothetical protein
MIDLVETSGVSENDNKWRFCKTEYIVLFMKDLGKIRAGVFPDCNKSRIWNRCIREILRSLY